MSSPRRIYDRRIYDRRDWCLPGDENRQPTSFDVIANAVLLVAMSAAGGFAACYTWLAS